METARVKADQTSEVSKKAHADAAIARQKAVDFEHIELLVGQSLSMCVRRLYVASDFDVQTFVRPLS